MDTDVLTPDVEAPRENLVKTVWLLAWPAVALNGLQTVNSLLDSNFIQHLEPAALTAIGAALTTVFLFISVTMAMGVASTAMVARYFGAGELDECRTANRKCLGFSVVFGLILTGVAMVVAPVLAEAFVPAGETRVAELMVQYVRIFAFMLPAAFVIQTLAGSLRGIGDTKSPMVVSGAQIVLHITLNFLLIFPTRHWNGVTIPGANMGLAGAATAMTVSTWVSATFYLLWCTQTPLRRVWKIEIPDWGWTKRIFSLALPAALMSLVRVTSLMAFTWILAQIPKGDVAIGAMRPGFSIESLAFMPSFGLAVAASALVGQSLGMKDPERAQRLGWSAAHMAGAVSTVVAICLFIFADQLAGMLLPDQIEFARTTASYLRHIAITEIFFGYAMVLISALQGAGDTRTPFWITICAMWGLRVPLAGYLAASTLVLGPVVLRGGMGWGADGCWTALATTQMVQGLMTIWAWNRGKWKSATV